MKSTTKFLLIIFIMILAILMILVGYFLVVPKIVDINPSPESSETALDSEIKIHFSGPINRNVLIPSIEPEIPGRWKYEKPLFSQRLFRTLTFYPYENLQPQKKYSIKLQDVEGIFKFSRDSYNISFTTQALPKIINAQVENIREIKVKLSHANNNLVDFDFEIFPSINFTKKLSADQKEYILYLKQPLISHSDYYLRAFGFFENREKETGEVVFSQDLDLFESRLSFDDDESQPVAARGLFDHFISPALAATSPPKITGYSPRGINKKITSKIRVQFSRSMNKSSVEKNFYTRPQITGDFSWSEDGRTMTFTPQENLPYGTLYKVVVRMDAKDLNGIRLSKTRNFVYSFKTFGRVKARIAPRFGAKGVSVRSYFKVYFDQPVDRESVKEKFYTKPHLGGRFSFSPGNTRMYFIPNYPKSQRFAYGKVYRAYLSAGVKSIYGLDSNRGTSTKITTQLRNRHLRVPVAFQKYPLSCEAAALRMAMAYKGKWVSEESIMNRVGIDPRPRRGSRWADPHKIFTGSLHGKQNRTGYGVYWNPIARAARVWRPNSKAYCGMSLRQLILEVHKSNPVVVWGVYGRGYADGWSSWAGRSIYAWKGEHARTVVGFIGSDNPRTIILNDPYDGKLYWSTTKFLNDWNKFGRCGVVVR